VSAAAHALARPTAVAVLGGPWPRVLVLLGLLLGCAVVSLGIGAVQVDPLSILLALFGQETEAPADVVIGFRLPRIVIGGLAGAGLAVAGVLLQGVTRNPLAAPSIVGINGGAALGAVTVLFLSPSAPVGSQPAAALVGGLLAGATVYVLARRGGVVAPGRLALVGIAIGALCLAVVQLLIVRFLFAGDYQTALTWLVGSLWGRSWDHATQLAPWSLILLPAAWLFADHLDLLALGDDVARGLGSRLETLRAGLLAMAVALAASAVAAAGAVAFVGLIAPHVARMLVGTRHRPLLPAAALLGAVLVLVSDALGRGLFPPTEIPFGLVTALIGSPYFLFLLRRTGW
jgi:ferric citrate transport system permease protein